MPGKRAGKTLRKPGLKRETLKAYNDTRRSYGLNYSYSLEHSRLPTSVKRGTRADYEQGMQHCQAIIQNMPFDGRTPRNVIVPPP